MVEWFNLSINQRRNQFSFACFAKLPFRVRTSCFNPRRSRRRSCFVGEFEKKLLHKLSIEVTDRCCNGIVREQWRVLCSRNFVRGLQASNMWQIDMCRLYPGSGTWPWYRCQQRVCIKWQHRRRRVRTRWCRKQSNCWWWRCLKRCYCNKTISPRKRTVRG